MTVFPILNIGQFPSDNQDSFYTNDFASHLQAHHKHLVKPHKHDFYLTVLFTHGSGYHEVDFHPYEIRPGSIFMLNPGQIHYWELSPDIDGYVMFHTKAFYDRIYANKTVESFPFFYSLQNSSALYLKTGEMEALANLFREVVHEHQSKKLFKHSKIGSLMDLLYIEISRIYIQNEQPALKSSGMYLTKFRELERLIDQHYMQLRSAGDYADMLHMSTRHLNRITQTVLSKTTTDLITDRIMLEAQRILSKSAVTVAEVAQHLGYEDHSYFTRLFRKKLSMTPSEFAERYKGV